MSAWPGLIHHYGEYLPVPGGARVVTLHEGNTPLVAVPNLVKELGGDFELYVKYEGLNPTGSFKDRGMTMAITVALARGVEAVVCASTGNTSAAAAAYAARCGMKSIVILPAGKIAMGKLAQALIYGAEIVAVDGNFDQALELVRELGKRPEIEVVNSINPVRIEGQKTASFEICDTLGRAPDYHFIPVGNAGNITAYWKGYCEYRELGRVKQCPQMHGWQAEGAAPLVRGHVVEQPETVATAIRIGNPASWQGAETAAKDSGGSIRMVSDEEILSAQALLASTEGVFVEPASAAPIAGLRKVVAEIPSGSVVVATVTGNGLKDPDAAIRSAGELPEVVPPTMEAVLSSVGMG